VLHAEGGYVPPEENLIIASDPVGGLGRAVQVDSIKTRVASAYGFCAWNYATMREKQRYVSACMREHQGSTFAPVLQHDVTLSNFANNFNLRRYTWARTTWRLRTGTAQYYRRGGS